MEMTMRAAQRDRAREKAKRRRRRKTERILAWSILFLVEIVLAALPTLLVAAVVTAFAYLERGYSAFGGEWTAVAATYCIGYALIHRKFCDAIFGGRERRMR